jgi:hypothetical protein
MRWEYRILIAVLCGFCLFSGCKNSGEKANFPLLEQDIRVSENRFTKWAEKIVKEPIDEAYTSVDALFERLRKDTVAYYVYSDWMIAAFYSVQSPCRNPGIFTYAAQKIITDGVMTPDECAQYAKLLDWALTNRQGEKAIIPAPVAPGQRTLVLVLDLGCPSCREALDKLSEAQEWKDTRKVALGLGFGNLPDAPGWEIYRPENGNAVFDIHLTPVYYVVSPDGIVEKSYTLAL